MNYKLSNGHSYFTQWDVGQYLIPVNPPTNAEYFLDWYGVTTGTLNQLNVDDDGHVIIPDQVFKQSGKIAVYCRSLIDGEYMTYIQTYTVKACSQPDGYIGTETQFADYIAQVEVYVDEKLTNYRTSADQDEIDSTKADAINVYTKAETDEQFSSYRKTSDQDAIDSTKANVSDVYTKTETDEKISAIRAILA